MKTRLCMMHNIISGWLARIGASLRRAIGRHAKHKCAPQPWRGGLVI